jgi:uncharacterized protein DUF5681
MAKGKDYEVGYGKPPSQHRFQKGQSGNPRGRRSAKLNEAELVAKVRDELITLTINGKTRRITAFEAAIRKTHMTVLAKGNVRDLEKLFQLYARYGAEPEELRNAQAKEAADKVIGTILDIFQKTRESRRHEIVTVEPDVAGNAIVEPPPDPGNPV